MIGAALLGGGIQFLNSLLSRRQAQKNVELTHKQNLELADYQHSRDVDMWNRMNEYNHPMNQMARLKDAGLNPKLVYGTGSVTGNTASQLPKYTAPTMDYSGIPALQAPDVLGQYNDFRVKGAQADNLRAAADQSRDQLITNEIVRDLKKQGVKKARIENLLLAKYGDETANVKLQMLNKDLSMKEKKNLFQSYVNEIKHKTKEWEKKGVSASDKARLALIISVVEALGLSVESLIEKSGAGLKSILDVLKQ